MKLLMLQMCIFVCFFLVIFISLFMSLFFSCLSVSLFSCLSPSPFSMHCMLFFIVCIVCRVCCVLGCACCGWAVRVVVGLAVDVVLWVCVRFLLSGTEKRFCARMYLQNARVTLDTGVFSAASARSSTSLCDLSHFTIRVKKM